MKLIGAYVVGACISNVFGKTVTYVDEETGEIKTQYTVFQGFRQPAMDEGKNQKVIRREHEIKQLLQKIKDDKQKEEQKETETPTLLSLIHI